MAQSYPRRRGPQGLVFYTTALVVSLFAVYSILRSTLAPHQYNRGQLQSRGLSIRDEECRLVHHASDKCAFVRANCPDEEAGLVSYLQLYYCSLPHAKPVAFTILVVWISLLFSTIGIAASDFLCINLSTIATILGMSESLTGVTFLAFGNGSPDVFSTFAAMSTHSGSLAVGELMGAAGFITAVVAGSMALVKPFKVAKKSFVRDVGFFAIAASFSLIFLADGSLRLWECAAMVGFYVFYVIFVVFWHWYQQRTKRVRLAETAARLHLHIPDQQELEVPDIQIDEEAQTASERTALLRGPSGDSIPSILEPGTPAWKLEDMDEDDDTRNRYLAELSNNMRINRPHRGGRRNTITPIRPSLIGALEFRAVLHSLEKKGTSGRPINLRRYSDDASQTLESSAQSTFAISQPDLVTDGYFPDGGRIHHTVTGRSRAVSEGDAHHLGFDRNLLGLSDATPQTAIYSPSPNGDETTQFPYYQSPLLLSPGTMTPQSGGSSPSSMHATRNGLLAPPDTQFRRPDYQDEPNSSGALSNAVSPRAQVPTLKVPQPGQKSPKSPQEYRYMDTPRSPAPSIHLPPPSLSPESNYHLTYPGDEDEEAQDLRKYKWWPYKYLPAPQIILSTLFPTLYGWSDKTFLDRALGVVTAPTVFLLTVTLPIVESKQDDGVPDPVPGLLSPQIRTDDYTRAMSHSIGNNGQPLSHPHAGISRQTSGLDNKAADSSVEGVSSPKDWNRWLVILQLFTAPLFVVAIVWANLEDEGGVKLLVRLVLASITFSLVCLLVLLATTTFDREPQYRPLFCFLGFAVAIAWIATIANEVVGVLKAFGVILDISDAILGLTIFAVGNSLGDLVADITVAKLGYPVMALSACFGGPMLNILLGIGLGGMYMTITDADHKHHKHPDKAIRYRPYQLEVSTTLVISGVTLLVTLLGLLVAVPLNGWRMDRKIGIGLIVLWTLSTIVNVVLEVMGIGG